MTRRITAATQIYRCQPTKSTTARTPAARKLLAIFFIIQIAMQCARVDIMRNSYVPQTVLRVKAMIIAIQ